MELQSAWCRLTLVFLCYSLFVLMTRDTEAYPIENSEHVSTKSQMPA